MSVESRGSSLAESVVWPALNQYPTAKRQDNCRKRSGRCNRGRDGPVAHAPDIWMAAQPFLQTSQVGGFLCTQSQLLERHMEDSRVNELQEEANVAN